MAADSETWSKEMDKAEHENTYGLFLTLVKWGTILCVAVVALMAIFLV